MRTVTVVVAILLAATGAHARADPDAARSLLALDVDAAAASTGETARASKQRAGEGFSVYGHFGGFEPAEEGGGLENSRTSFAAGAGLAYRFHPHFVARAELFLPATEYDTPDNITAGPFGTVDEHLTVVSAGLLADVNLVAGGRRGPGVYGGAGFGLYHSTLEVSGSTFGFSGTRDETDTGLGYHAQLGLTLPISENWRAGFELRRFWLDADFGEFTTGDTEIGGTTGMFMLAFEFDDG